MRTLRATARLVGFLIWSALCVTLCGGGRLVGWLAPGLRAPLHHAVCRLWARGVATMIGLSIRVSGTPPTPPYFLVSNHLGYIDIITLLAASPAVFVSRGDLKHWPVMGILARTAGTLFVDRSLRRDVVRINALIEGVLAQGHGLTLFPEGTSSGGDQVLPFRSSLLEPAAASGRPVHWACTRYEAPAGGPHARDVVCWWGEMTFLGHFWNLLGLASVRAAVHFGPDTVSGGDRHALASTLHDRVSGALAELQAEAGSTVLVGSAAGSAAGSGDAPVASAASSTRDAPSPDPSV